MLHYVAAKSYMELWQLNCFFLFFFGSVFFHPIHFDDSAVKKDICTFSSTHYLACMVPHSMSSRYFVPDNM